MNDRLLTVDQVSEYLGVHRDTVYSMIRSGRLPALQLGGRKASWRISESDLAAFVSNRKALGRRNGGGPQTFEEEQLQARDDFERQQQRDLAAFQSEQERRLAEFEARQERSLRDYSDGADGHHADGVGSSDNARD